MRFPLHNKVSELIYQTTEGEQTSYIELTKIKKIIPL